MAGTEKMTTTPVILITGATDGLGRALAECLATDDATLVLHGRDPDRLAGVADSIRSASSRPAPTTVVADLADLQHVRGMAREVLANIPRLDVLVSNAGIGSGEPAGRGRNVSADGYELRFAVNYLAGFLLTLELLPLLRAAAPARVVNVASLGQNPLDFEDLMLEHGYSGTRAYGQSKLAQIMSGFEFARRFPASEITFNSLHPATYMPTKMVLDEIGHSVDSLEVGVAATYRLVSDRDVAGVTGKFFDRQREARANAQAYDPGARQELWSRSLEFVDHIDTTLAS